MTILNSRAYYLVNHKYRSKVFYSINQNTLFGLHRPSWALASSQALIAYVAAVTGHLTFTMGDRYLTLTGTGAPRLVLAPDPRRNGGPDISDDYQYWKLVSMHDDSGKRLENIFSLSLSLSMCVCALSCGYFFYLG